MRWFPVVVLLVVTAACDSTPVRPLSALSGKEVSLGWSPATADPEVMEIYVQLDYNFDVEGCVAVDATATLDGKRLKVFSRGESGEEPHSGSYCERPGWTAVIPAGGDPATTTIIEIEDETAAITYELVHPFAERTIRGSAGGSTQG